MRAFEGRKWRTAGNWGFWFRIFGYGLSVSNMAMMFSERYGYRKVLRIGSVKIGTLKASEVK